MTDKEKDAKIDRLNDTILLMNEAHKVLISEKDVELDRFRRFVTSLGLDPALVRAPEANI